MARRIGDDFVHPLPEFSSLPPIPPAHLVDRALYMGPTEESNWVLHPALLVGAFPSSLHDPTNAAILTSILGLGVTTFVCLQQEYKHEATEEEWRGGAALRPYIFDAIRLVDTLPAGFFKGGKIAGLEFVHFPIKGEARCARAAPVFFFSLTHTSPYHRPPLPQTAALPTTPACCN